MQTATPRLDSPSTSLARWRFAPRNPDTAQESHEHMTKPEDVRAWFEQAVTGSHRLLFSIAYRILGDSQSAEDAVQDAALKAYARLETLRDPSGVVRWLSRITKNAALDIRKKGGATRTTYAGDSSETVPDPGDPHAAPAEDERRVLYQELDGLPERQALVVTLRFLEDLSTDEVADRLGITRGYARVLLHRGLERLRSAPRLRRAVGRET
jgi:RNA polymerase sigma-70 factor (ECF subfamily)